MPKSPESPHDFFVGILGAPPIMVHQPAATPYLQMAGAWMTFDPKGYQRSLSVQAVNQGGHVQRYAGYRDGHCMAEKLAISVNDDDSVTFQIILPGDGDEHTRTHELSLTELEKIVADHVKPHKPKPHYA